MRKIKTLKQWGIYKNNAKEAEEYGFEYTVLHPDNMVYSYLCDPGDSDIPCETLEEAIEWIKNY